MYLMAATILVLAACTKDGLSIQDKKQETAKVKTVSDTFRPDNFYDYQVLVEFDTNAILYSGRIDSETMTTRYYWGDSIIESLSIIIDSNDVRFEVHGEDSILLAADGISPLNYEIIFTNLVETSNSICFSLNVNDFEVADITLFDNSTDHYSFSHDLLYVVGPTNWDKIRQIYGKIILSTIPAVIDVQHNTTIEQDAMACYDYFNAAKVTCAANHCIFRGTHTPHHMNCTFTCTQPARPEEPVNN